MNRRLWMWSFPLVRLCCFPPTSCTVLMITTAIARAIARHGIICPKNSIQKGFQREYTKIDMWRVSIEKWGLGAEDCIVPISTPYFSYT